MKPYRNSNGDSGVVAYQIGARSITIRFRSGDTYRYDADRPGLKHVRQLQALAEAGAGLSTYISQHVRDDYAAKL